MNSSEQFTRNWTQAQPLVANFVGALVPDFAEAEDLLQEVAVVCLRKFDQYDPDRPFAAWALGMARYEVLHWLRHQARNPLLFDETLLDGVTEACEELAPELDRRAKALRECLQRLEGRARELIRLRYDEGLKPGAIAVRLNSAMIAVRVRLSRARKGLRDCISSPSRNASMHGQGVFMPESWSSGACVHPPESRTEPDLRAQGRCCHLY